MFDDSLLTREQEVELAWAIHQRPFERWRRMCLRLAEGQGWRCCYCGCRMSDSNRGKNAVTVEHVLPKIHGGKDDEDNLVAGCSDCNQKRGNRIDPIHIHAFMIMWGTSKHGVQQRLKALTKAKQEDVNSDSDGAVPPA